LSFDGTSDAIEAMIRNGQSQLGDLFLDYDVCGNLLSRPGLDRLFAEIAADSAVSHVLIPRRDRFARPDDPLDAIALENSLRRDGITLVFMDRTLAPIAKGQRVSIEDMLGGVIDYDRAGKDRTDLAQKIIYAQLSLAKAGYSTGGRPPYGFRRWLVRDDGTQIRQLEEAERVRMRGHHVVWLPGPESELAVIYQILDLLRGMPASRVARLLTDEGIPSPDAGRTRTDNGIKHLTRGVWNPTTIINIARNPLLQAMCAYGRRSMGDQLRYTANGPRALEDDDFRADGKPKVIRNPDMAMSRTPAHFDALVAPDKHQELIEILNQRGASQRGKPRSRDPDKNPLGSRIFDMNCGWPMYRTPYKPVFRYSCGAYMQSQDCDHNHVDGPTATEFALSCLVQKVLPPRILAKLKTRLAAR
jgi:DNA invertase Pin-like site-specific DNA recombinase